MSIPCRFERSILSHDEHELLLRTHHPEIYEAELNDLKALRQRLRDMRDKENTLARAKRREARGKETHAVVERVQLRRAKPDFDLGRSYTTRQNGCRDEGFIGVASQGNVPR
jgi:hypothetical protein